MINWTKILIAALAILAVTGMAAHSAGMTQKDKCLGGVKVIAEMQADEETPDIGEKAEAEVTALVEIATHLCMAGNFAYAGELMSIARGMMVSE